MIVKIPCRPLLNHEDHGGKNRVLLEHMPSFLEQHLDSRLHHCVQNLDVGGSIDAVTLREKMSVFTFDLKAVSSSHCDVVANVLDSDTLVSKFELQSGYFVHFRTNTLRKGMIFLWHINHCRLLNAKSIFYKQNSSISNNSV